MCTLTYIPSPSGYTFTHNRDERQDRPTTQEIQQKKLDNQILYYPKDLEANGTWIAQSNKGISACLLNGGSETYTRKSTYRKSRGLVVLESFEFESPTLFYNQYDFQDIEPFTLLIRNIEGLYCVIHDEQKTSINHLNINETHIWSSTTLYPKEVRDKREVWFANWLAGNPKFSPKNIRNFHLTAGEGSKENDLVMSRWGIVKTLSLTQISVDHKNIKVRYNDLIADHLDKVQIRPQDEL